MGICKEAAMALLKCMQDYPCMQGGGKFTECVKEDLTECTAERRAFFECKRGQLDMRTRIRGPRNF
ncbi:unnamed protein product [Chrysoparadoxa australica]